MKLKNLLDENSLISILLGKKQKASFEKFSEYGSCTNFEENDIRLIIQELAAKKFISRTSGTKRLLELLEKGERKTTKEVKIDERLTISKNYEENLYLFNLLRESRKKASEKFLQQSKVICPDEILREIVERKPATKGALLALNGFTNRMYNKIGDEFLEIINDFILKKPVQVNNENEETLPRNIHKTYELLLRKYSLKSIAELRKLSEAVISMQIESILEYKPETEIIFLFDKKDFELINKQIENGYENLKDLKAKLPQHIPYSLLRIAAAKYKSFNPS